MASQPQTVQLTKEERLEVQLLNLQRDNIQLQATRELERVQAQMEAVAAKINQRLGGNVDISQYQIDFKTGVATLVPPTQDPPADKP